MFPCRFMVLKDNYCYWRPHAFPLKTQRFVFGGWVGEWMGWVDGKKEKTRKLPKGFVYEMNVFKCSLTSGNIKHYSLEEADLPRDHQRKIVPLPITALLKGYILMPAPFNQWVFDPRSLTL